MSQLPPFDKAVPVLTLKVSDYVLHHGDLAIARTFGRVGVPCIRHPRRSPRAGVCRVTPLVASCGRLARPSGRRVKWPTNVRKARHGAVIKAFIREGVRQR